jgi:hypothetical protein
VDLEREAIRQEEEQEDNDNHDNNNVTGESIVSQNLPIPE